VALLEFGHVEADHRLLIAKQCLGEGARQLGLANPCRPEKQEAPLGPVRVGQPGPGPAHRLRDRLNRLVLAHDPLV